MCISKKVLIIVIGCLLSITCLADEITVISWNVESGGADPGVVAGQMAAMNGVDIWGLCEVDGQAWAQQFETGIENGGSRDLGEFSRHRARHIPGATESYLRAVLHDQTKRFRLGAYDRPAGDAGSWRFD